MASIDLQISNYKSTPANNQKVTQLIDHCIRVCSTNKNPQLYVSLDFGQNTLKDLKVILDPYLKHYQQINLNYLKVKGVITSNENDAYILTLMHNSPDFFDKCDIDYTFLNEDLFVKEIRANKRIKLKNKKEM